MNRNRQREEMAEMKVWFTFIFYFRQKEEFYRNVNEEISLGIQWLVDCLDRVRVLRSGLDKEIETELHVRKPRP